MKLFKKAENLWKDPVWSKIIANNIDRLLLFIFGGVGLTVWFTDFLNLKDLIIRVLIYKLTIPVWVFVSGLLFFYLAFWLVRRIKNKRSSPKRNPILDELVGNYKFEELVNILSKTKLRIQTPNMQVRGIPAPNGTLLQQFLENYDELRAGISTGEIQILRAMGQVNRNDEGYITDLLIPKLMEYGLIEATQREHSFAENSGKTYKMTTYNISSVGYEFYDHLETLYPKLLQAIYRSSI